MIENKENLDPQKDKCLSKSINKPNNLIEYLDLIKDSEIQKSSIKVLKALDFLSNCIEQHELKFDELDENEQITVVNVLLSFIYMLIAFFKDSKKQLIEYNDKILNDISNTLDYLSENTNTFVIRFHEVSNKSIESIFNLLDSITNQPTNEKINKNKEKIFKLLLALFHMSKINSNYESSWNNARLALDNLKIQLANYDQIVGSNWLIFLIHENLKQNETKNYFNFEELIKDDDQYIETKIKLIINYFKFSEIPNTNNINNAKFAEMALFLQTNYYELDKLLSKDDHKFLSDFTIKEIENFYNDSIILIKKSKEKDHESKTEKNFLMTDHFLNLLSSLTDKSLDHSMYVHNNPKGLKILLNFLNCQTLIDYYTHNSDTFLKSCYAGVICALNNLSRLNYKYFKIWNACDSVNVLLKFLDKTGEEFKLDIYIVIASIATDKQIETLPEIKNAIQNIVEIIRDCVNNLDGLELNRIKIQVNENEEAKEILSIEYKSVCWNIVELLESLYHMSVNDSIKKDIYETYKMKDILKKLIFKGNDTEKSYALKLLYQLCFDNVIIDDLSKDDNLMNLLKNLSSSKSNDMIKKSCDGILWKSNYLHSDKTKLRSDLVKAKNNEHEKKQIMISYNGESRALCLSIKTELEKLGYKIWIDVENIAGSSLESMAEAIEKSFCILMGMTEKYKLSPNCRLEAEYAIQLNKPIIPLILQEGYKPNGWLGIILGSKIFVNFKKYSFEECVRRLLHELEKIDHDFQKLDHEKIGKKPNTSSEVNNHKNNENNNQNGKPPKKDEILTWKEDNVEEWIKDKKFSKHIIDNIRPCNGKILYQMLNMLETVPEFFYSTLRADSNNRVSLRDLADFSFELKQLFS